MLSADDHKANGSKGGRAWPLTTIPRSRKKLVSLINQFHRGEIQDIARFRAMVYGMSVLLSYFSAEQDQELEKRIASLERRFGETLEVEGE